jgi:hypothetical protein
MPRTTATIDHKQGGDVKWASLLSWHAGMPRPHQGAER